MNTGNKKNVNTYKVTPSNFDIKRFKFNRVITEKKADPKSKQPPSRQFTVFPKYVYPEMPLGDNNSKADEGETLTILTAPIEFKRGGVPKYNPEYHKNLCDTAYFWVPLDEEFGGSGGADLKNMLEKIDNQFGGDIKKSPDEYLFSKTGKEEEAIEGLKYSSLVKKSPKPANVPTKEFKPWYRCKVKIPYKEDENHEPIIGVKLAYPNEETGKTDSIVATSLSQLQEYFRYGCKAQFVLEIKTFWALKSEKEGERQCGFKLTCSMIRITERSKSFAPKEHEWDDFIGGGDEEESGTTQAVAKNDSDNEKQASKSNTKDESDDEESDNDSKKKVKAKSKEETDDDSDEDKPKQTVKSSSKSKPKEESDDEESEEEEKKPAKKPASKASKTKFK